MPDSNYKALLLLPSILIIFWIREFYSSLTSMDRIVFIFTSAGFVGIVGLVFVHFFSTWGRERRKKNDSIAEIPIELLGPSSLSVSMGVEADLGVRIFLPDQIRTRHVHILGATGSGKTESVILNFLKQDVLRDLGSIILDAKGDNSFIDELSAWVPPERLIIFDLSDPESVGYDPLAAGSPLEAAQRLFSSLTWSEEYYKSKAISSLQRLFQAHYEINSKNPNLADLATYLDNPDAYVSFIVAQDFPKTLAIKEFQDLSGLRDQIRSLTIAHLKQILSPAFGEGVDLKKAAGGAVIYFRLQSLMSPQLVSTVGKLVINHLNFLAGTAHRARNTGPRRLVPVYFDEFASFACPEFADLISKARSAGFALHFSHQSIGDLMEISPGFLNQITDNAATKIILRINDPDSAEFFSRCFGTKQVQKTTQRITNSKNIDSAEILGEGTTRDAHQFRAAPNLLKTLPTGTGAVLVAHGRNTPHGASSVFTVRFPALTRD
jgi:hypothetical protein